MLFLPGALMRRERLQEMGEEEGEWGRRIWRRGGARGGVGVRSEQSRQCPSARLSPSSVVGVGAAPRRRLSTPRGSSLVQRPISEPPAGSFPVPPTGRQTSIARHDSTLLPPTIATECGTGEPGGEG
jgi:hypothetical protein